MANSKLCMCVPALTVIWCILLSLPMMNINRTIRLVRHSSTWSKMVVPDRCYFEVSGPDSKKYLQGVCTNDILKSVAGDCTAAAFLNPKGRIVGDGLLFDVSTDTNQKIIIETSQHSWEHLGRFLTMYRLRSNVVIKEIPAKSILIPDRLNFRANGASFTHPSQLIGARDPRAENLGYRVLIPDSANIDPDHELAKSLDRNVGRAWFERYRLLHGLPESRALMNKIPLECNLDLLHYISFSKGCYVGQELTARAQFKGVVRKRLLPFLSPSLLANCAEAAALFTSTEIRRLPLEQLDNFMFSTRVTCWSADNNTPINVKQGRLAADDRLYRPREQGRQHDKQVQEEGEEEEVHGTEERSVGEVVEVAASQDMGVAMMKLDDVYSHLAEGLYDVAGSVAPDHSSDCARIAVFMPSWWPELDPLSGKPHAS